MPQKDRTGAGRSRSSSSTRSSRLHDHAGPERHFAGHHLHLPHLLLHNHHQQVNQIEQVSGSTSLSSHNKHHRHTGLSREAARDIAAAILLGFIQGIWHRVFLPLLPFAAMSSSAQDPQNVETSERTSLLGHHIHKPHLPHWRHSSSSEGNESEASHNLSVTTENTKTRSVTWGFLTLLVTVALVVLLLFRDNLPDAVKLIPWIGGDVKDPMVAALDILNKAPVIDGHIDLPIVARFAYANNVTAIDLNTMPAHVDIPRLRKGKVGGFFWSVYVDCAKPEAEGEEFLNGTWRVRDTLEQIDVSNLLIDKYSDTFQLALSSSDIRTAIGNGKIASLLGVEGGHQLGNSIAVLRQYHALGVRYVTLTHTCHNAFADSCGYLPGIEPLHGGLSSLGLALIDEMNRLGVLVDLSHTSDATATQALKYSKAPVIWSHSSARAVHNVPRNVPDEVLKLVGTGEGQKDAVVMVNFAPQFVAPDGEADVVAVANHVEHIANIAGKKHVGLGSDFDGISSTPKGLEDVSKYPALIAELYSRGWTKYELAGLTGANLLRIFEGAEKTARELKASGMQPVFDLYDKRTDIPVVSK